MQAQWIAAAGGALFFLLGALHLRLTVRDMKDPQHFAPARKDLLAALKNTRINLRKDVKDFWTSYLGFHVSHSVGLLFYGCVVMYCALVRPDILSDIAARLAIVTVGAAYVLMARAFWFVIPFVGAGLGVTLIAVGFAMMY
ncbi:MAG: LIC_13387 family protein [Hyphococcus sp.]